MKGNRTGHPGDRCPLAAAARPAGEGGSALVTAMFVLLLLTTMGLGLLFLGQLELKMSKADSVAKATFYLAEAGIEHGREATRLDVWSNADIDFMLDAAAGPDDVIDFTPQALKVQFDADDRFTGMIGYDDDVPLIDSWSFGDGLYSVFVTNDAIDGKADLDDTNDRVVLTAVGVGPNRAVEMIEAIVERDAFPTPPAAITMLGPDPTYYGGSSPTKLLIGDDCQGTGVPGLYMPVIGAFDPAAESRIELGVVAPDTYRQGTERGTATVDDVTVPANPLWSNCSYVYELARDVRAAADVVGDSTTPWSAFGTPANPKIVFIDDDYVINAPRSGGGLLWVTGRLIVADSLTWRGVIFVVGRGIFMNTGAPGVDISGAVIAANLAGPDEIIWTADDCAGDDGLLGTADDGYQDAFWDVADPGDGTIAYCGSDISLATRKFPFEVVGFRQH